jgi:hypothetical protein
VKTQEHSIQTKRKHEFVTGCIDRFNDFFIVKTHDGRNDEIVLFNSTGVESSYDLGEQTTNFIRPANDLIILFSVRNQAFIILTLFQTEAKEIPLDTRTQWNDSEYELRYFSRSS